MKKFIIGLLSLFLIKGKSQNSPEQFLGYNLGEKYTLHYKIINYFDNLVRTVPTKIKKISYGQTYEGRELAIYIIANEKNLANIEEIRKYNLALTLSSPPNLLSETPAIVWLSYNVHGNEPASSEAAMKTAYFLLTDKKGETLLQNIVVIIDPCINPDGRDRYVNWVNSNLGKNYNPLPQAREHVEASPSGRTNHYNFDLNRDWCWQTQIESQSRVKLYHQWLPQIHVDYHEQGPNEPYYFAPAAEPLHEQITPFQRTFQEKIGQNNAKYFDENHWLYFTRERFDLLYPSYGDTYPTYNGAIGMTYEQGGISGALGIINEDKDTLTLVDRVAHHFTTGISTIEVAAQHRIDLLKNFISFFRDNYLGKISPYKSYVITANNQQVITELTNLFKKNNIEYSRLISEKFKGTNLFTNKEENFETDGYSIVINLNQKNSRLANILLEPTTQLTDSNTYDITAWSLAFNYNVKTYGIKEPLSTLPYIEPQLLPTELNSFGYLIPYNSLTACKVLAKLLKHGIKVRYALKDFTYNNVKYFKGTLVILATSNGKLWSEKTIEICSPFGINPIPVTTGLIQPFGPDLGSPEFRIISSAPRIALATMDKISPYASGEIWHFFDQDLDYPITLLNISNSYRFNLNDFDVLILPDGNYKNLSPQWDEITNFVERGGKLICLENAIWTAASTFKVELKKLDSKEKTPKTINELTSYENQEKEYLTNSIPGAIYKVILDNSHPLCFGFQNNYYTLKQDANVLEINKNATYAGNIKEDSYVSGFVGKALKDNFTNQASVFGSFKYGKGEVIFFVDNLMFRQFWQSGKRLFSNAVFITNY